MTMPEPEDPVQWCESLSINLRNLDSWLREDSDRKMGKQPRGERRVLAGTYEGRPWVVQVLRYSVARVELTVQTYFRGAPDGKERGRRVPFFYLGPVPASIPYSRMPNWSKKVLWQVPHQASGSPLWIQRTSQPDRILGASSYPKMEQLLHSDRWMSAYDLWASVGKPSTRTLAPLVAGLMHQVHFVLSFSLPADVRKCSDAVQGFIGLADTIETGFDVPLPSQEPMAQQPASGMGAFDFRFLHVCPSCGKLETVTGVHRRFSPVIKNFRSDGCGALLFKEDNRDTREAA